MLAAVAENKKFIIKDIPIPKVTKGTILVKTHVSGINYSDIIQAQGLFPLPGTDVIGSESAGVVVEVGEGVTDYQVGDRVYVTGTGSHAEYTLLTEAGGTIVKIPDDISFDDIVAYGLQAMTAIVLVEDSYPIKKGDTVLIHAAAGGVGSILVQLAHQKGARVFGSVSTDEKAAYIKELGADDAINYRATDFLEKTLELTNGEGVDAVFDSVGRTTFAKSVAALRTNGVALLFGAASGPAEPYPVAELINKNTAIKGVSLGKLFFYGKPDPKWWTFLFNVIRSDIKVKIHNRYSLQEFEKGIEELNTGKTIGRLLLEF